jgi:lipopolysaccharide export system protein LptA
MIIVCCLLPLVAKGDKSQAMVTLEADSVNYDYKKGVIHYDGNVHATQGTTDLTAKQMVVYYNQAHKIEKIVAIGNLAHYKTLLNENKDTLKAAAMVINYFPIAGKVILENQAQVEYNNNLFSGPYIYYDMINKRISSHPDKNSRSKVILEPIKQLKQTK